MCAQDKELIKTTFHNITKFITSGSSRAPTEGDVGAGGAPGSRVAPYGGLAAPLPPWGAPQMPQAPPTGAGRSAGSRPGSPYSPSRPTLTSASPGSTSPGERRKPTGTWAARVGRDQEDSGEEDNNERRDGNTNYNSNNIMNVEPSSLVKMNDSFIPSDQENTGSQESVNNTDTLVKENETIIPHST